MCNKLFECHNKRNGENRANREEVEETMTYHENHEHIGLVEAVETLTSIADLELDGPIAIAEKHEIQLQELPVIYRTVHWLHRKNAQRVMHVVLDTYKVILNYLRHFYKREHGKLIEHESIEGIKTVMVLVGEAAKKVDRYSRLFVGQSIGSVKQTKEFRELVTFYQRKIAPIGGQESLSRWMSKIPVKNFIHVPEKNDKPAVLPKATEHVFIDLDSVKKDVEHELFFIRKADGSRFFGPRLLRNIKLVCNFEQYVGQEVESEVAAGEPVQELKVWKDHAFQCIARNILRQNWHSIDQYVKACHRHYNNDLAMILYRLVVALMLSANQVPKIQEFAKGSSDYFKDCLLFLREVLSHTDFQRIVTYPPKDEESIQSKILFLVHEVCRELYLGFHTSFDVSSLINQLIARGRADIVKTEPFVEPEVLQFATRMSLDYDAMMHAMQHFGHTSLMQTIQMLQSGQVSGYDPILMQNIPGCLFDMFTKGKRIAILRVPSPTTQDYIQKAHVCEEFKAFIRSLARGVHGKKHLVLNLQDRTGWKEFARCHAIEEIQKKEEFNKSLVVVSMSKESDFYHQVGPYQDLTSMKEFMQMLLEHVESENTGCSYPQKLRSALFGSGFAEQLAVAIHELFFAGKNVLSRHARMDFIELFYLFMQLKIIELVQPTSLSFTCKDGIDISLPACIELFLALKLINDRAISKEEEEYINLVLYSPAVLIRGRNLFLDRFNRLNTITKVIEAVAEERGSKQLHHDVLQKLSPLFDTDVLSSVIAIPQPLL